MRFPDVPLYERGYRVEGFMADRTGRLAMRQVLFLLDDIMARNADYYGIGFDFHLSRGEAWVLTDYDLVFHGRASIDDTLIVGTCPYSFKKAFGYRLYRLRTEEAVMMEGLAKFALYDLNAKTIKRPDETIMSKFHDVHRTDPLPMARYRAEKTALINRETAQVRDAYIDVNGHMNNAHYLALALERMPKGAIDPDAVRRIQVHYRKEALEGDNFDLLYYKEPRGVYVEMRVGEDVSAHIMFHLKAK